MAHQTSNGVNGMAISNGANGMATSNGVNGKAGGDVYIHIDHVLDAIRSLAANSDITLVEIIEPTEVRALMTSLLESNAVKDFLMHASMFNPFTKECSMSFANDVHVLSVLKHLKYFYVLPVSQLVHQIYLLSVCESTTPPRTAAAAWLESLRNSLSNDEALRTIKTYQLLNELGVTDYNFHMEKLEKTDPEAVFPTNMYRRNEGHVAYSEDYTTFESTMTLTLTSSTKIRRNVLDVTEPTLASIYKPLGRCVAIVDSKVDCIYGEKIGNYFAFHGVKFTKRAYSGNEVDKDFKNVERILVDLKQDGVARNEPVLIIGGGVITDVGGFACALYHRSTPYVMLCTSIVAGIDAGPSPRTCCDGLGYKNLYGAYHPPVVTVTDRSFFKTLPHGLIRHGIAEIIKMAAVKDEELFSLLEFAGPKLITTKFGTDNSLESFDGRFEDTCDLIIGRALARYLEVEYENNWETHQCRPHAFGHTWSPGYELPAGMLHGHAVATGMGYGAYLSFKRNWINADDFKRLMKLMSSLCLSLWHPIMSDVQVMFNSQRKMTEKRGGRLCAPVPRPRLGACGYINDVTCNYVEQTLKEYKDICKGYPRNGLGVEVHCRDVGLDDPST